MKLINLILSFSFLTSAAFAGSFRSSEEIVSAFKTVHLSDLKNDDKVVDQLLRIDEAVTFSTKNKLSSEALQQILRVAALTLRNDPNFTAGEILIPLYNNDKKAFNAALKKLSPADSKAVLNAVSGAIFTLKHGNG